MKTKLAAAVPVVLVLMLGSPMALAEGPRQSTNNTITQTRSSLPSTEQKLPHYELQYHYVGRHARLEGYWVLVR
jgi:hypothetical protein